MAATRREVTIELKETNSFIYRSLQFARTYSHFTYFNNNNIPYLYDAFPHMLMIGCLEEVKSFSADPFNDLKTAHEAAPDWYTGYFGYDLKNYIENLKSNNHDRMKSPDFCFYRPEHIILFTQVTITLITYGDPEILFKEINSFTEPEMLKDLPKKLEWQQAMGVQEYLQKVGSIQEHIINGDIYEMNFCLEFFAENQLIDPLATYLLLNNKSPMPFSLFGKYNDQYVLCASPERFLKKKGKKLISQPIKGTARRGQTPADDAKKKNDLKNDEKEQAENLMIVDLVRNDLAKSANAGSVKVEELFGIYTFRQVHQMISTIVAEIKDDVHFTDAIKNAFPMGSMTGAPKIKVMELIEHYENSKRGIYSGAAGFITPEGDFDINVIIRSLLYNKESKTLSFHVGSAITYDSIPQKEYEECLLKAHSMLDLSGTSNFKHA